MKWARWEGASKCTGNATPGARALLAWLLETYPQGRSMGIYNCRGVRGARTKSIHAEGRALDYNLPVVRGRGHPVGHEIVRRLGQHGDRLGIQTVIFDRKIWSGKSPNGRAYGGVHPHYDHLHIELTRPACRSLTLATFRQILGGGTVTPDVDPNALKRDDRGPAVKAWQEKLKRWSDSALPRYGADGHFGDETVEYTARFMVTHRLVDKKPDNPVVGPKTQKRMDTILRNIDECSEPGDKKLYCHAGEAKKRIINIFKNRDVPLSGVKGESEAERVERLVEEVMTGKRSFDDIRRSVDNIASKKT